MVARSKDMTKYKKIVENLSYSKVPFLRVATAILLFVLSFVLFFVCFVIGLVVCRIPTKPENDFQLFIFIVILVISMITATVPLVRLYDKLFRRDVSLTSLDRKTFELVIDAERFAYPKVDIQKVHIRYKRNKRGEVVGYVLTLKMREKVFRFGSKKKEDKTLMLYERLLQWQEAAKCKSGNNKMKN